MAEIAFSFTSVPSLKSHTGDTTYTDISDATIGDALFTSGDTYLLFITAQLNGTAINERYSLKVQHGSTDFAESEVINDPAVTALHYFNYTWFTTWEAVTSEGIKLQFKNHTESTETVSADFISLFAMNLSNDLTKDTDWHFDENSSTSTLNSTYGDPTDSAITFTPSTSDQTWLVMSYNRIDIRATNNNVLAALDRAGEASSTLPEVSQEGENTLDEFLVMPLIRPFNLGASENVFRAVGRNDSGSPSGWRVHNAVFALNLDKFSDQTAIYSEDSNGALGTTDYAKEIQSTPYAPTAEGNIWVGGFWRTNSRPGQYVKSRMQIDDADMPPGQTTAAYELNDAADDTDQWAVVHQAVINLDTSTHTVDLDGSQENEDTFAHERSIFSAFLWTLHVR